MLDTVNSSSALPEFNIPENKKDEDWHKKCVVSIVKNTLGSGYDLNYKAMTECMQFYNGDHTGEEFKFMQTAEDGDVLPAKWIPYNKIRVKVDLLLGELNKKNYDINVRAINKEAEYRKKDKKDTLYTQMRLKPVASKLEEDFGMSLQQPGFTPDNEEELDEFMKYSYKERSEIVMEAALKYLGKKYHWDYIRLALFRDILINGRAFVKNEIKNGLPCYRRIDPRNIVFDKHATDDFLSDSVYIGEVRYMGIAECAEHYSLKKEQIDNLYARYKQARNSAGPGYEDYNNVINGASGVSFFKEDNGELRVLVYSAEWFDTKMLAYKMTQDPHGNEHIQKTKDTYKGADAKKTNIKIIRKATLIGGDIMVDWGELKNQTRDIDKLYDTKMSYSCVIPNYINYRGVSKVEQMMSLQKFKDITMYNVQLAMSRAGAKGFMYDVSQCPDEWDVHTVIKYLKSVGIAFIDSKKDGQQSTYNQFQAIDMTLSASVAQYLEISRMIDSEMDAISGINEARQGIVQNSSQAVGVTQSALMQSNLSTETLFELFAQFASRVFTHQAGLVKISWTNKERFAPIIGESGVDFINEDIEVDLDDYGVFVEVLPTILEDKQMFQGLVTAALQAGGITFLDAVKLLKEKDLKIGIREFERSLAKKQEEAMKMQQQQAQQEQAAKAQLAQQQQQAQAQQQQSSLQSQMELNKMKSNADMYKTIAAGNINKEIEAQKNRI